MRRIRRMVAAFGVVFGLATLAAPVAYDVYATHEANRVIKTMSDVVDWQHDEARQKFLVQARAYNRRLAGLRYDEPEGGVLPYDEQLSWRGKPYMAYIHIPALHLKLPIYHGTAEAELSAGIGHLEGRSLPVGGEASLCVLEGHSGMLGSRMFDDIRSLQSGDMLCLWTLAEPYAYRMTSWEICDPEEVEERLAIEAGDRVCLVTCTTTPDAFNPRGRIGVNDKRLLVWCERCAYDETYFAPTPVVVDEISSSRSWPLLAAGAATLAVLVMRRISRRGRRKGLRPPAQVPYC